jgi:hypothetical protein
MLRVPALPEGQAAATQVDAIPQAVVQSEPKLLPVTNQLTDEDVASRCQKLLAAFTNEIKPVRKSLAYVLSLPLVAFLMVLLPLAYLTLIVVGVYYVPICGIVLALFMIKPLFARPAHQVRTRSLTPEGEPILFAVVERLCEVVGAPLPKRIDVDYQFSASARFRRGFWSMFGNDLVLTIGIPLAAGLSLRQLVGVLAHEFGHFSQGTGMRLRYTIYSINHWFVRVVFERDAWDAWLAEKAERVHFRIGWLLALSMVLIWLSRCILWGLMMLSYAISGFLVRQMEYDADLYEARVVGAETFETTIKQLQMLGPSYQMAQRKLFELFQEGNYPDDLSCLTMLFHGWMPQKVRHDIEAAAEETRTGFFDTHPCEKDRIAAVRREPTSGVFRADGPARALFCHFDALARNVTWDLYCTLIGPRLNPNDMKPVEHLLESS